MIHPFLVIEIPLHSFFDTLLKLERWLPAEFLLKLARVDGVTHIKNRKRMSIQYFPFICVFIKKQRTIRHDYMKHLYQYLRLLLWRILDAIDRKLGPGPGDHRP